MHLQRNADKKKKSEGVWLLGKVEGLRNYLESNGGGDAKKMWSSEKFLQKDKTPNYKV